MTLVYQSTRVQQPSAAPSTSNAGSTYQVRHRRVNQDGGVSLWSTLVASNLPATFTPQSYSDSSELLRDEFLVSDDSGVTWRIYPGGNVTGAQTITAFDSGWVTTTNQDTQNSAVASLDFGEFSDTEEPELSVFVLNRGTPVDNLKVSFLDLITNNLATAYLNKVQVTLEGTYQVSGNGPSSLFDQSLLWTAPQLSLNNLELVMPTDSFIKLTIRLTNFPAGTMAQSAIQMGMELIANQRTFFLGFGSDWLPGSYYVDQNNFQADFLSAVSDTQVQVGPYLVNFNGVLFTNFGTQGKQVAGVGTGYKLAVDSDGNLVIRDSATALAGGENLIATFDITGSSPWISNVSYAVDIKPGSFGNAGGTLAAHRFVNIDSSGNLVLASTLADALGISLIQNGYYATTGLTMVQAGGTVSVGDRLVPTTDGKAIQSASGPVVALADGALDDLVLVSIISLQGGSGGGGGQGPQGPPGADGDSAYQVWLDQGNTGTEQDFLDSLVGPQGDTGPQGNTGPQGDTGPQGIQGIQGNSGNDGDSAYQVWLSLGNSGTEQDFINSLQGPQGDTGPQGIQGIQGDTGPQGPQGDTGPQGPPGSGGGGSADLVTADDTGFTQISGANVQAVLASIDTDLATKADLNSPDLTGAPTTPTPVTSSNDTTIASTAFVKAALQALYPVGSLYFNGSDGTNPSTLLGFGTWTKHAEGRVIIGHSTTDPDFDTVGDLVGNKIITLTIGQLPAHGHNLSIDADGAHTHTLSIVSAGSHGHTGSTSGGTIPPAYTTRQANNINTTTAFAGWSGLLWSSGVPTNNNRSLSINSAGSHGHTGTADSDGSHGHTGTADNTGNGDNIDITPASIVTYVWLRTA